MTATKTRKKGRHKAITVAKDVLKTLRGFSLTQNTYLNGKGWSRPPLLNVEDPTENDVKAHAVLLMKKCNVCLLGACFLSFAKVHDGETAKTQFTNGRWSRDGIVDTLTASGGFAAEDLNLIEDAFQAADPDVFTDNYGVTALEKRAIAFGMQFKSPHKCVEAVMKNVIKNKGRFVPPKIKKGR